ncbi:MAG: hypothetical protein JNM63_13310 [Spirochaetia bacterium]|nr:hypothetical protein [Spirochaetia bacterium]
MPNEWHFNEKGAAIFAGALAAGIENALPAAGAPRTGPVGLSLNAVQHQKTGLFSPWALVSLGTLWLLLSIGFKVAYPDENPLFVFVKIALLLAVVVSLFMGIGWLTGKLPPLGKVAIFGGLIIALATYGLYKTAPRLGTIRELFGALVDRGHWYLVPMLVVMLAISILLVVAQNPIVAPFIYTLF